MNVFLHHIYEYKKGLRSLILHTLHTSHREEAERKLDQLHISYVVREVTAHKINIFFGAKECVEVINSFGSKHLYNLSAEEDFILGTLLGYDPLQQCNRYLQKTVVKAKSITIDNTENQAISSKPFN